MKQVVPLTEWKQAERAAPGRTGDDRFLELLEKYGEYLRRMIAQVCPSNLGLSVDDIEQEARVRLWRALLGEREIVHPVSYIYKVAVSATIHAIHRIKARREEHLLDAHENPETDAPETLLTKPEASPEALAERRECVRKINASLARLPENRRIAVGLHLQGMTTTEIGDLTGWTEPKARNLVHRGLKDLRVHLRAEGIEYGQ
jgi:RNA polymerase sigma factor (sigma-70 family)